MRQNPVGGVGGPRPADNFDECAPAKNADQKATNNCQQANEWSAKLEPRLVTSERDRRLKRDTERTRRFIPYWIRSSGCRPRMFRQLLVQHERVSCDDQKRKRSEREFADPKGADWRQQYAYAECNAPKCDRRRFVRAEWQRGQRYGCEQEPRSNTGEYANLFFRFHLCASGYHGRWIKQRLQTGPGMRQQLLVGLGLCPVSNGQPKRDATLDAGLSAPALAWCRDKGSRECRSRNRRGGAGSVNKLDQWPDSA